MRYRQGRWLAGQVWLQEEAARREGRERVGEGVEMI